MEGGSSASEAHHLRFDSIVRLTFDGREKVRPTWSPDGTRFMFSSTHDGNRVIYTVKSVGTDIVRLTRSPGHDAHPSWSPKGDRIAFATDRWGGLEIDSVKPDGTGVVRLTESPEINDFPSYSPDASNSVNISNHPERDTQPTWMLDGLAVTFVSDRKGGGAPSLTRSR